MYSGACLASSRSFSGLLPHVWVGREFNCAWRPGEFKSDRLHVMVRKRGRPASADRTVLPAWIGYPRRPASFHVANSNTTSPSPALTDSSAGTHTYVRRASFRPA